MSESDAIPEHWYFLGFFARGWLLADLDPAPRRTLFSSGRWELVLTPTGKLVVWIGGQFFGYRARNPQDFLEHFLEQMPEHISRVVARQPDVPWNPAG
jgi:hypothetical protein